VRRKREQEQSAKRLSQGLRTPGSEQDSDCSSGAEARQTRLGHGRLRPSVRAASPTCTGPLFLKMIALWPPARTHLNVFFSDLDDF